jgi:hypothetical protein
MPTAVRDASSVTIRNRNMADFSYYTAWQNQTMKTTGPANFAVNPPVVGGANLLSGVTLGGVATLAFNNELIKNGGAAAAAVFSNVQNGYDSNVAFYPPNPSSGGAGRRF